MISNKGIDYHDKNGRLRQTQRVSIIGAPESEFEESPNGYMMDKGHNSFHHIN